MRSLQRGYMLIGMTVAVGIIGTVGGLLTTSIFQFSRANSVTAGHDEVAVQVTRASRWLTRDIRNHATTDLPLSGTASTATFNSRNADSSITSCNYSLSGTDMIRDCDGNSVVVGSNIENLVFERSGSTIDVTFDVVSASRPDISEAVDLTIRSDISPLVTGRLALVAEIPEISIAPVNVIDFENDGNGIPLSPGEIIDNDFAAYGMSVWVTGASHGAMVFDSSHPSGNEWDLGSPHEDFGGPGKGGGGKSGAAGENAVGLDQVLIISKDGDSGDPDSEPTGGVIHFAFTTPVDICSVGMFDVQQPFGTIETFNSEGLMINSYPILKLGNNSVQTVSIGDTNVAEMQITLPGSAAVSFIELACSGS